jgi:uncharacterized membrane protein
MSEWYVDPVFNSTTLVVALGAALLAALMFLSPELRRLRRGRRNVLLGLRLAIFLLVVLAMFRPAHVYMETKPLPATVIVLVDRSRSMQVQDELGGDSRWASLKDAVAQARGELQLLDEDLEINVYEFDREISPIELSDGRVALSERAEGDQSAIGAALDDALRRERGKRIAAVILLSDGAQQAYAPRDTAPQIPVRQLQQEDTPLFTLAFGKERSAEQARDVAITELLANPTVSVKNKLPITATLRATGLANQDVPVQILWEKAPGQMEVVETLRPRVSEDGQRLQVETTITPEKTGEHKLTVKAIPPDGLSELVTTNNELSTFVTVLEGGLRVLYLEGALREEQAHLRRALNASQDLNVDFELFPESGRKDWPKDTRKYFERGAYDVYVVGDLDAAAFRPEDLTELVNRVDEGAGLIMLGGAHSFWPGGYKETPLRQILPIESGQLELRQNFGEPMIEDPQTHLKGPLKMLPDRRFGDVSFMRLAARADNQAAWEKLPPLKGANHFRALKQAARAVAVTPEGVPLLAAIEPGKGRVLAFAGDSTYQWKKQGFDAVHKRFWRQVVLWLAHLDESSTGNVYVKLDQRRISPGRRVQFTTGMKAEEADKTNDVRYTAEVVLPNDKREPVRLSQQEEQAEGWFVDTQEPGDYKVIVTATTGSQLVGTAEGRFTVHYQDLELDNPAARPAMLASLSKMTASSGGRPVPPEAFSDLLREIAEKPPEMEIESQTKYTPWDKPEFFIAVVGLLCVEWYLRKKWGMV